MNLKLLRSQIDQLDSQLLALLNQRTELATAVGQWKSANGQRVFAPDREENLLHSLEERNHGPMANASLRAIYREILSSSRACQSRVTVGFTGSEGGMCHWSTVARFGCSERLERFTTLKQMETALRQERIEVGVVSAKKLVAHLLRRSLDRPASFTVCGEARPPFEPQVTPDSRCFLVSREPAMVYARLKTVVLFECNSSKKRIKRIKSLLDMHKLNLLQAQMLPSSPATDRDVWLVDLAGYVSDAALRPVADGLRSLRRCMILGVYPEVPAYA